MIQMRNKDINNNTKKQSRKKYMLTSKERLLKAINLEEPDHVPLNITFIGDWVEKVWKSTIESQIEILYLGLDPILYLSPPWHHHPDVKVNLEKRNLPTEKYPILIKTYDTPEGGLRQVVVKTPDWPHGDNIPLFSDHAIPASRTKERLIKNYSDLKKLQYLLQGPSSDQVRLFRQKAKKMEEYANEKGIMLIGDGGYGGDAAIWICGFEKILTAAHREPEFLHELLGTIHQWDLMRTRELLNVGVDLIRRRGYYESPPFWSPELFKRYLEPLIREEIEIVHQAHLKFHYIIETGIAQLLPILSELDIDLLDGMDPIANPIDLDVVRKAFANTCIRGGMSEAVTLSQGTTEEIRKEVKRSIEKLAPGGGFIFGTIYSILTKETWERKVPILIKSWNKYREYPIRNS
jgi:hypothetical protein